MRRDEFWNVIELGHNAVTGVTELPDWLQASLRRMPLDYIGEYELQYRRLHCLSYDTRLWGAAGLIMRFCSDDKFADFRAWLIAKGRRVFENALEDPDSLADVIIDGDCGLPILCKMNYVAEKAYRERVGRLADITELIAEWPKPVLLNAAAWDGDRKSLPIMFPKLFAKYGG